MRKITWFVFCMLVCSGLVFSQSITVTKPKLNDFWYRGYSGTITWTKSGSMPDQVGIALLNTATNAITQVIIDRTPNDGSHSWSVPLNFNNGRYKIAVRARGTDITGISPAFNITLKRETARPTPRPDRRAFKYEVTVIRPRSSSRWEFGDTKDILVETNFDVINFQMDLTSQGNVVYPIQSGPIQHYAKDGNTHKYRYRWWIGEPFDEGAGTYRVRVKARSRKDWIETFSDGFYLSGDVEFETKEVRLEDSRIVNVGARPGETLSNVHAIVGKEGSAVYKSQVIFPLEFLQNKNVLVLKAELQLSVYSHQGSSRCPHSAARQLHVFTGPWTSSNPDPAYFYKKIPVEKYPTVDVRQQVISWITGQEPNHGFLLKGPDDLTPCYSKYNPYLVLKYRVQK